MFEKETNNQYGMKSYEDFLKAGDLLTPQMGNNQPGSSMECCHLACYLNGLLFKDGIQIISIFRLLF